MTVQKRLVTVTAVVMTEETGGTRLLVPIDYPLVRFEARSEVVPGEVHEARDIRRQAGPEEL